MIYLGIALIISGVLFQMWLHEFSFQEWITTLLIVAGTVVAVGYFPR